LFVRCFFPTWGARFEFLEIDWLDNGAGRRPVVGREAAGYAQFTLVIWGGLFGDRRGGAGRQYILYGFAMGMAGTGILGGRTSEAVGLHGIADRLHVHEVHATSVRLRGVDQTRLIHHRKGRLECPILNHRVVSEKITG
jgi:hypothetical protein